MNAITHLARHEQPKWRNCADSKVEFVVIEPRLSAFAKGLCSVLEITRQLLGDFTDRSKIVAESATKHYHSDWLGKLT